MTTHDARPAAADDTDLGFHVERSRPGDPLLVAFGGMAGAGNPTLFEFGRLTRDVPSQRCLLRDHQRAWYHHGVRGAGDDLASVERLLRRVVDETQPERIVMVGVSTGGYAAMLFGHRVGADVVHAFSPQTFLDPVLRRRHREPRWSAETAALMASGRADTTALDLAVALRTPTADRVPAIHLWYCPSEQPDAVHATHVIEVPAVTLHCVPHGDHLLVKWLRDEGHLIPILASALAGDPRRPSRTRSRHACVRRPISSTCCGGAGGCSSTAAAPGRRADRSAGRPGAAVTHLPPPATCDPRC